MKELEHRNMSPRTIQRKLVAEGVDPRQGEISWILRHFETSTHAYNTSYCEQDDYHLDRSHLEQNYHTLDKLPSPIRQPSRPRTNRDAGYRLKARNTEPINK